MYTFYLSNCINIFETYYFSCVPKSECLGLIKVRGSNELVCEDASLTCCHEASMKKQNKCEDHSPIGYR